MAGQNNKPATPAAQWRTKGEPDPHGNHYDCERAKLCMGDLSDDELANAAFMNYDHRPAIQDIIDGKAYMPIVYMTAVKERIRWLSRALVAATSTAPEEQAELSDDELAAVMDYPKAGLKREDWDPKTRKPFPKAAPEATSEQMGGAQVAQAEQPIIGKLLDEFSALPVLWGLNEPGALVRHSDVFKMLVTAGKSMRVVTTERAAAPSGMQAAAAFIDKRAADYLRDHADNEPCTGAVVFHYGEAGRDYHSALVELADDLRAAEEQATERKPLTDDAMDAARYRFLRKGFGDMGPEVDLHNAFVDGDEKMDAAIDAAIAQQHHGIGSDK